MDVGETIEPAKEGMVKTLSEQLVSDPNSLVFASLADMYREEGMMEEALAMCQAGLTIHPRHVPGRLILAKIHRDALRPREAREALEKVLVLEPGNPEALALLQSLETKPGEPSSVVPSEGLSAESAAGVVSALPGPSAGLEIIPEPPVVEPYAPQVGKPSQEEGLKLVPWGDAASVPEVPSSIAEGRAAAVAMPEIERSATDLVPGAVAQEGFVISRPIDLEFPKPEPLAVPPAPQAPAEPPLIPSAAGEEAPIPPAAEPAQAASKEEPPVRVVEVPAGVEVLLNEEIPAPPVSMEEKPAAELPTIPLEGSLFAAPTVPLEAPAVEEETGKPRREVPLAEFMKSLSESEFMKATPTPVVPVAERAATEPEVLSDEMRGEMEKALEDLLTLAEVEGAMIVNRDGLVLAERTRAGINAEEAAALAASIFETTLRSIERMHLGQLDRGIVETASGRLYLTAMGDAMVVLLTRDDTKMGLVLMRMKKAMERVRRVLG